MSMAASSDNGHPSGSLCGRKVLLADGHTRQALPMARALRKLGCRVTALCSSRLDMGYHSRWVNKKHLGPAALKDADGFLAAITRVLKSDPQDVVIPLLDGSAAILSRHKPALAALSRIAVPDWPIFISARDKLLTMRACHELGTPAPRTYLGERLPDNPDEWGLPYPIVIKPRESYAALGFSCVNSSDEARAAVRRTQACYGPVLAQEYIPQTGLQHKAELMIETDGSLKAAVVFSKVRWYPVNGGSSTLNVTEHRPDIVEICHRLLRHLGWVGYADVDLIDDPRDGFPKVMEINPRITGSVKITFGAGVDFAELIVRQALGEAVPERLNYRQGVYLRYFLPDVLWFLKSPNRFTSRPSWFDFRNTTDQVFSIEDPLPGIVYIMQSARKLLRERR